ncbi:MAG: aminoglycoside phosphotransferase family protein [Paramuribaculum sp.]|nr:aminoglycoside phosphotransferase family protein [Paramuribaculum sp.]
MDSNLLNIASQFALEGTISNISPLGSGLINDTFRVETEGATPDYVLQRINHHIFTDVDGLQRNILAVTNHIRAKLQAQGVQDIDRHVLRFLPTKNNPGLTYHVDQNGSYWRIMVLVNDADTFDIVNEKYSREAGAEFGRFQAMLVDIPETLIESIPDFHNMEFRLKQLKEALEADPVNRLANEPEAKAIAQDLLRRADEMTLAEQLHREGKLPKRICHCDTKVNNMLFDKHTGKVLCVIDLDTVMPSFVFSDYGDFLRTAANTGAEDDPDLNRVGFNMDIFRAFTEGYLSTAGQFLTETEKANLPYAAKLFPYMQAVRFFADYINGDTYYKIQYPEHNLVRTRAQIRLLESIEAHQEDMKQFINSLL